jgi:hypothetical protein
MRVTNPGSGSGSGTVTTDGVTIQGDGSAGSPIAIKAVQLQARLTGAGTVASKLDIGGWPLNFWQVGLPDSSQDAAVTQNFSYLCSIQIGYALAFSKIALSVHAGDAGGVTAVALYDSTGARIAHTTPANLAAGYPTLTFAEGSQTINPGDYWFLCASAAVGVRLYTCQQNWTPYSNEIFTATVGGVTPTSITPPAYSLSHFFTAGVCLL